MDFSIAYFFGKARRICGLVRAGLGAAAGSLKEQDCNKRSQEERRSAQIERIRRIDLLDHAGCISGNGGCKVIDNVAVCGHQLAVIAGHKVAEDLLLE